MRIINTVFGDATGGRWQLLPECCKYLSDAEGHRDMFTSGEHALLILREQPEALADALQLMLEDYATAQLLARKAFDRVAACSSDRTADMIEEFLAAHGDLFARIEIVRQPNQGLVRSRRDRIQAGKRSGCLSTVGYGARRRRRRLCVRRARLAGTCCRTQYHLEAHSQRSGRADCRH